MGTQAHGDLGTALEVRDHVHEFREIHERIPDTLVLHHSLVALDLCGVHRIGLMPFPENGFLTGRDFHLIAGRKVEERAGHVSAVGGLS